MNYKIYLSLQIMLNKTIKDSINRIEFMIH